MAIQYSCFTIILENKRFKDVHSKTVVGRNSLFSLFARMTWPVTTDFQNLAYINANEQNNAMP